MTELWIAIFGGVWLLGPVVTGAAYLYALRQLVAAQTRERAAWAAEMQRLQRETLAATVGDAAAHTLLQEIDRLQAALSAERADRDRLIAHAYAREDAWAATLRDALGVNRRATAVVGHAVALADQVMGAGPPPEGSST